MDTNEHEIGITGGQREVPAGQKPADGSQTAAQALDAAIDILEDVQKMVARGRPKALRVKFGDKTVAEFPLAITAAAAFAAGLAAVLLTKLAIEIVSED